MKTKKQKTKINENLNNPDKKIIMEIIIIKITILIIEVKDKEREIKMMNNKKGNGYSWDIMIIMEYIE